MLNNIRIASYLPQGKEKTVMKLPNNPLIGCVLILCITLLIFTLLTRRSLCELRLKDGEREVAARLACGSDGK
ncbi:Hok/Gef family protein [Erwinia sp. E602]|nr:Hok/Gef family protein [Erwinia sp. E602]